MRGNILTKFRVKIVVLGSVLNPKPKFVDPNPEKMLDPQHCFK
jgi:hypothetical protein